MSDWPQQNRRRVTALPASAADGEEIIYIADDTNGIEWQLKYKASETTYKWRFIGGSDLIAFINDHASTLETTASTTYADLATVGPSITLPLNGDFILGVGFTGDAAAVGTEQYMSPKIGGATALDADATSNRNANWAGYLRYQKKTGLTSGTVIKCQYRTISGTARWAERTLIIRPIRVS